MLRKCIGWFCIIMAAAGSVAAATDHGESVLSSAIITVVFLLAGLVLLLKRGTAREEKAEKAASPTVSNSSQSVDAYINTGTAIYRTDGRSIEDREVPYLVEMGLHDAMQKYQNSSNPKWHRTEKEEKLSTNFFMRYGALSDRKADAFRELVRQAYQTEDINERIELLKAALLKYNEVKAWHYNKSKGAMLWFQDMWENMHNSQNECFSWDEDVKKDLLYWISVRDEIIPKLMQIFSESATLQKDVYAFFPEQSRADIRKVIDYLAQQGAVVKEKKGSTYLITIS